MAPAVLQRKGLWVRPWIRCRLAVTRGQPQRGEVEAGIAMPVGVPGQVGQRWQEVQGALSKATLHFLPGAARFRRGPLLGRDRTAALMEYRHEEM